MAATEGSVPRQLSTASGDSRGGSPFAGHDKPHTSISSLPDLPAPMDSTARRRRRSETQELRTKVELLGTKVFQFNHILLIHRYSCSVARRSVIVR